MYTNICTHHTLTHTPTQISWDAKADGLHTCKDSIHIHFPPLPVLAWSKFLDSYPSSTPPQTILMVNLSAIFRSWSFPSLYSLLWKLQAKESPQTGWADAGKPIDTWPWTAVFLALTAGRWGRSDEPWPVRPLTLTSNPRGFFLNWSNCLSPL